jgi:hypothetical protein
MYGIDLEVKENNWNGERLPSVGQMGIVPFYPSPVKIVHAGKHEIAFDSGDDGLDICKTYEFKPIPNPGETAKQKAIDEIDGLILRAQESRGSIASIMVEEGYTKSKVKPLPTDWYKTYYNSLDNHHLSIYKYLIAEGYCIGSAD